MANRDTPVNGRRSKLSLREDGNLVLIDAGQYVVWSTQTGSTSSSVQLQLRNSGNLVLNRQGQPIWQSFDHPTDTLLPNQPFTKNTQLVSSRSSSNYSSGFYKLFFDTDSILRLLYDGLETSSTYWPDPRLTTWRAGRYQFIDSRKASLDSDGQFISSDGLIFKSADFGNGPQRMMKVDVDGNLRLYSLVDFQRRKKWEVQWQALSHSCWINGACGPNSVCTYSQNSVRECTCLHGYKMVNSHDWSYGCEPEFQPCTEDDCGFLKLPYTEFYGHDYAYFPNHTLGACKNYCLQNSTCRGFNLGWLPDKGFFCFLKSSLHNGYQMGVNGLMFIKLPKSIVSSSRQKIIPQSSFGCPRPVLTPIIRSYDTKNHDVKTLELMLVFGCIIGFIEIISIVLFWYFSSKRSSITDQIYFPAPTEFRRFTYSELKRATRNFSEEIGKGGSSVVYKGRVTDDRIAAIKRLESNHQGEAEFQAEISTIGRVNHMNLLETWGYCAEGKHRLVVYEYLEKGSLADNLGVIGKLEWNTRLDIALGTAKGLAYLHDECLEWVLHCDVKPQNILLDANFNPKVADFGLSKLLDRGSNNGHWNFSMMRGTRGYMAPEWVLNQPITSKVDVYSYGVVMLEMITGRSPTINQDGKTMPTVIEWVRDVIGDVNRRKTGSWVKEIVDRSVKGEYDENVMENLVRIAVQCTEEDRDARPSMSEVVNMLLHVTSTG